jgi:4-amino-4-deoxy-L-arabinose transferase-like glycosyltransferase
LITSSSYLLFGFGIWQTRLPGVLFGALVVGLYQHIAASTFRSPRAGFFAALLVMVWPPFLTTARAARMDTPCLAFLAIATILLLSADRTATPIWRSMLAGLAAGLAGIMHSAALPWLLGLLSVQAVFFDRKLIRLIWFGLAAVLPASVWFGSAVRFPEEFRKQFLFVVANRTSTGSLPMRFVEEVSRCFTDYVWTPFFFVAVGLTAFHFWQWRRDSGEPVRRLLVLIATTFFGVALLAGKDSGFYNLYYTLPLLIFVAGVTDRCLTASSDQHLLSRATALCGLLLFVNCSVKSCLPIAAAITVQREARAYDQAFAPLSCLLNRGDQVWGAGEAWYACVQAGARLDIAPTNVPIKGSSVPDPYRHRFVVVAGGIAPPSSGFTRLAVVDRPLPVILGWTFSNAPYHFEIWKSDQ